jgi:hypothetical protein
VDLPPELRTGRRILFIGDSVTAGLGNLGNATCNLPAAVGSLENSFLSYAGLTASQLQADFQVPPLLTFCRPSVCDQASCTSFKQDDSPVSPSAIDLPQHCYSVQALSLLMLCVSQFNFLL